MKRHYFAPALCIENLVFTGLMTNGIYNQKPVDSHEETGDGGLGSPIRKLYV